MRVRPLSIGQKRTRPWVADWTELSRRGLGMSVFTTACSQKLAGSVCAAISIDQARSRLLTSILIHSAPDRSPTNSTPACLRIPLLPPSHATRYLLRAAAGKSDGGSAHFGLRWLRRARQLTT